MKKGFGKFLKTLSDLTKLRITFFVMLSTVSGYMLHGGEIGTGIFWSAIGIFFMAAGSSGINQLQEIKIDAKMNRTKNRPIPAGDISPVMAVTVVTLLVFSGSAILYFLVNTEAFFLGWLALLWYNLLYTPLKRKFVLAVVPGSLVGSIPPVAGWVAAGGNMFDPGIITLAMIFFIWQIPHFWLLLLIYDEDYGKAGLPTLSRIFNTEQLKRVTFIWILALVISGFLLPLFNIDLGLSSLFIIIASGIWLLYKSAGLISKNIKNYIYRNAFISINFYILFVIAAISIDQLIF